jgi:hypothetical protein
MRVEESIDINRPIKEVFNYISEVGNYVASILPYGFTQKKNKEHWNSSHPANPYAAAPSPPCTTRSTKGFEIEFCALLTNGAQEEVRFEWVAVGST